MSFSRVSILAITGLLLVGFSCSNNESYQKPNKDYSKEEIRDYNKLMAKKESQRLQEYVETKKWPAEKTGTGLYYWVYDSVPGPKPVPGNNVKVNLTICFLNGDTAYSHVRYGSENFLVDRTNKESGLNEGIQYVSLGSKAKLLMPSHLAHGLVGDAKRIPPRTPLVFDVELVEIN